MDPIFEKNRKDIERIQAVLKKDKALEVTFEEAGTIWHNISRSYGGAGWLLVPENNRIINYIQTSPGFTNYQDSMKIK